MSQPGFFDLGERYRGLDAKKDPLVVLNAVVPWEDFRAQLSAVWRKPEEERKTAAGRKPWDEIIIFKTLVLQALYNLSDDQVEDQIRDRLSFMRFLGVHALPGTGPRGSGARRDDGLAVSREARPSGSRRGAVRGLRRPSEKPGLPYAACVCVVCPPDRSGDPLRQGHACRARR